MSENRAMPQNKGPFKLSRVFDKVDRYFRNRCLKTNVICNIHLVGGMEIRQKMSDEKSRKFDFVDPTEIDSEEEVRIVK